MNEQHRILVVDDEPQITRVLQRGLRKLGYDVRVAAEGEEALRIFTSWTPDLVITDLFMPNVNGLELCRRLRAISGVPIIVLSVKGEEPAKVEALDIGADDYVTKPFGMNELLARMRAIMRRAPTLSGNDGSTIKVGDFQADLKARSITVRGREVRLTPKEYDLLVHFLHHPGMALTHRSLLVSIWGANYVEQTENLRVLVNQLRKKVELDPAAPRYILTEPWIGYRFDPVA